MTENLHNIVTLQNIDDEDFVFEYNTSEGNPPYLIPAGEVARFPKFLAEHALKHLVDKILNKNNERTDNQVRREELANEILLDEETLAHVPEPTEDEKLRATVKDLNQPSTLDKILSKKKAEKEHKEEADKREIEGEPTVEEAFEGLEEVESKPKEPPKVKKKVVAKPTRGDLLKYAEDEMKMVLDDKTTKKFKNMKIDDLITELNYPLGA